MTDEEKVTMRRLAEDARAACNAKHPEFVQCVSSPIKIIGLLDEVDSLKAKLLIAKINANREFEIFRNELDQLRTENTRQKKATAERCAALCKTLFGPGAHPTMRQGATHCATAIRAEFDLP